MSYRPDWDLDRDYGEAGEDTVRSVLNLSSDQIEVKRKRYVDTNFYVELDQSPRSVRRYKPSGLSTTKATYWAYVIGDTDVVVLVPTHRLKNAARYSRNTVREDDGDNPTRGKLVSFASLLGRTISSIRTRPTADWLCADCSRQVALRDGLCGACWLSEWKKAQAPRAASVPPAAQNPANSDV